MKQFKKNEFLILNNVVLYKILLEFEALMHLEYNCQTHRKSGLKWIAFGFLLLPFGV